MDKQFINEVKILIAEANAGKRVNVNYVATIFNKAFGTNRQPTFCKKCIRQDIDALQSWVNQQEQLIIEKEEIKEVKESPLIKAKRETKSYINGKGKSKNKNNN